MSIFKSISDRFFLQSKAFEKTQQEMTQNNIKNLVTPYFSVIKNINELRARKIESEFQTRQFQQHLKRKVLVKTPKKIIQDHGTYS